jgi:hypothetical protein
MECLEPEYSLVTSADSPAQIEHRHTTAYTNMLPSGLHLMIAEMTEMAVTTMHHCDVLQM